MNTLLSAISNRWEDCGWPKIGYFVHGQARDDIAALVRMASAYEAALSTISSQSTKAMALPDSGVWAKRVAETALNKAAE